MNFWRGFIYGVLSILALEAAMYVAFCLFMSWAFTGRIF